MTNEELAALLSILGKTCTKRNQDLLERLTSLEHWSNQQDILLQGLMIGTSLRDEFEHLLKRLTESSLRGGNEK